MTFDTSAVFGALLEDVLENTTEMDLASDAFKVALFPDSITPDEDAASAATQYGAGGVFTAGAEISDSGNWLVGGEALDTPTLTRTGGVLTFDAVDTVQTGASCTLAAVFGCLVYDDSATTPVIDQGVAFLDFGGTQSVTAGDFTIAWAAGGIFNITFTAA
jgi:hypothetical protein